MQISTAAVSLADLSFDVGQASPSYQITNFECFAASQKGAVCTIAISLRTWMGNNCHFCQKPTDFPWAGPRFIARSESDASRLQFLARLVFNSRALESVRNTKGKLMPCLEIHSRQDGVRHLGDTEVDGKPGGLHAPAVER
jgi:hypothetical protein